MKCVIYLHLFVTVDLLAITGDVTLSWTSPIYPKLYSNDSTINPIGRPITENEDTWIGSLLTLAACIGPIIFSIIAETFGRKIGLLAIGLPHIFSYLIMAFATDVYMFYFARFIGGLALGGGYCLLPMYIAEISKETERGTLSQTMNVFWAVGNFIPYAIGPFLSIKWFNSILATIPLFFVVVFLVFGKETPFYYVKIKQFEKAEKVLMHLRSKTKQEVQEELDNIKRFTSFKGKGGIMDIINDKITRKYLFICLVLISTQEFGGFCAITFHLQLIFEAAGTNIGADYAALIVGIVMIVSSLVAPILIDRLGRRFLTITSCFGMCLAHILIGTFFFFQADSQFNIESLKWIPIFSLILYIFSFNFGISTVPWTLISEIFPSHVKETASFFIASLCWIVSFVMTSLFNTMNNKFGRSGTFSFFAVFCLLSAIFSIIYVPETMGKSFLEIQKMLSRDTSNNLQTPITKANEEEIILQNTKIR